MILKARKKPIIVEAVQVTGTSENIKFLSEWSEGKVWPANRYNDAVHVKCLEALALTPVGSYVVKGVKGEVWPIREDIFLETYEIINSNEIPYSEFKSLLLEKQKK